MTFITFPLLWYISGKCSYKVNFDLHTHKQAQEAIMSRKAKDATLLSLFSNNKSIFNDTKYEKTR